MSGWRIVLDVDSSNNRLRRRLLAEGWHCESAIELGWAEHTDEQLLGSATALEMAVYTCNRVHFARIHSSWMALGKHHFGIIIRQPQDATAEQQFSKLLDLRDQYGENIQNQLLWATAGVS